MAPIDQYRADHPSLSQDVQGGQETRQHNPAPGHRVAMKGAQNPVKADECGQGHERNHGDAHSGQVDRRVPHDPNWREDRKTGEVDGLNRGL